MPSKYFLAEQVLYRLELGYPDVSSSVQLGDIIAAIPQVVNVLMKAQQFNVNMPNNETIPENLIIGIYENVPVVSVGVNLNKSMATLPIMPISLPKNMGIFQIYEPNYPDSPFIPLQAGQTALLRTDALLSDLLGQVSYEPKGNKVFFNKDLPLFGINIVTMELVAVDSSKYSDTENLPIPADIETPLIEQLVAMFAPVGAETGGVNPYTGFGQKVEQLVKK